MGFIWAWLLLENQVQVNHRLHGLFTRVMLWAFPSKTPWFQSCALERDFLRGVSIYENCRRKTTSYDCQTADRHARRGFVSNVDCLEWLYSWSSRIERQPERKYQRQCKREPRTGKRQHDNRACRARSARTLSL